MLIKKQKSGVLFLKPKIGYISFCNWFLKLFFNHLRQRNYIEMTKYQVKLVQTHVFNVLCLQKFSSNGQIWQPKIPHTTTFNWA